MASGIDVQEAGRDFIVVATDLGGNKHELRLTEDQMLDLMTSAPNFRAKIVERRQPQGAGARGVLVTRASQFSVGPDSLGEDLLLTLATTTQAQLTFALSPHIARLLAEELPKAIAEIETPRPLQG